MNKRGGGKVEGRGWLGVAGDGGSGNGFPRDTVPQCFWKKNTINFN